MHKAAAAAAGAPLRAAPLARRRRAVFVAAAAARAARRTPAAPIRELDLKRLYSDPNYLPERTIGPVEVQLPTSSSGSGPARRRVVTTRDVPYGSLLFVSEPLAGVVVRGPPGEPLLPPALLDKLARAPLSDADRYRLSVLYDGTAASQQRPVSFKDLGDDRGRGAAAKAGRAKAAAKGFGGGASGGSSGSGSGSGSGTSGSDSGGVELTPERFEAIVTYNAWGAECADLGAAPARGDDLSAFVGLWPEFALLNHACMPNAVAALVGDRLVVRAASTIPKGAQVTVSYLDSKGGVPLAERRRALDAAYGFRCGCARCRLEEAAPEALREHLSALHAAAQPGGGAFDGLPAASEAKDAAALAAIARERAAPALEKLNTLLDDAKAAPGSLERAMLSASAAGFLMQAARAKVAAALAAEGDGEGGSSSSSGGGDSSSSGSSGGGVSVDAVELLDLVEVLRVYAPGGPGVLATAADALSVVAAREGPASPAAQAALRLLLKMIHVRYGEVADRATLERLVDAITRSAPRLAALGLDGGFAIAAPGGGSRAQ